MKDTNLFSETLSRLKTAINAKTDTEFAKKLKLGQSAVSSAKTRGNVPPIWIETIAKEYNISANWLFFGEGPMKRGEDPGQAQAPQEATPAQAPGGMELDELRQDNRELRQDNRELRLENKELRQENRDLRNENRQLRESKKQDHFAPKTEQKDLTNHRTDNDQYDLKGASPP